MAHEESFHVATIEITRSCTFHRENMLDDIYYTVKELMSGK
jgi:hypothetical protein